MMPTLAHRVHRLALLTALWLVLVGPDPAAWVIGAPTLALATWASLRLRPPASGSVSIPALLRFLPFFAWQSLRGGVDVALRVLRRRPRVAPGTHLYPLGIASPAGRVLLLNTLSLLPGSLSADLDGDRLTIHALDVADHLAMDREIAQIERRVASLFGERLETEEPHDLTKAARPHDLD